MPCDKIYPSSALDYDLNFETRCSIQDSFNGVYNWNVIESGELRLPERSLKTFLTYVAKT